LRKISKGMEPDSFSRWKRKNNNATYDVLFEQKQWDIINEIGLCCSVEQFYLCAYCCSRISGEYSDTRNEHVEARRLVPNRSVDFSNIVASCKSKGQCDSAHGSQYLPLTPLMIECETEFKFKISGRVEGMTRRACESIRVLNLGDDENNNKSLIEKRKQLANSLLWVNGIDPEEGLEDDDLLMAVIDELLVPKEGKLEPFSPVAVNILRNWVAG
jgi:uncharacterized protein (TIGR02646 family)